MKKLKKILAVLSAGTMLIGGAAMSSMTASADASYATPNEHIALHCWTTLLEENDIPFSSMGTDGKTVLQLETMLKEKNISAKDFCSRNIDGMEELSKIMAEYGLSNDEINRNFIICMLGMQGNIKSIGHLAYNDPDYNPECIQRLESQGYTWNDNFGWEFDVDAYFQAKKKLDTTIEVMTDEKVLGDLNSDGIFNISDVVSLQKALSTSTATLDMDVNGDGKVNVFDVVALKRMLTEDLDNVKSI